MRMTGLGLAFGAAFTALVLVLTGCSATPTGEPRLPPTAEQQLDQIILEYADSRQTGASGPDQSAGAHRQAIQAKRDLLERLHRIPVTGLSPAAAIDHRVLSGLLESSIHTDGIRRVWENQPALYLPASGISRALESVRQDASAENLESLNQVLGRLELTFDHARRNLKRPPRFFTDSAIFQAEQTLAALQTFSAERPGLASVEDAVSRLELFLAFLREDLLPRSDSSWALGKPGYDFILRHRWHMDDDADSILARGLQAFEDTEALAREVADRIQPGADWITVYETLKDDHPPADGIKAAYQSQMDAAQIFVLENRILTLPAGERVVTLDTPPAMRRLSPFGTFDGVDPLGDELEGRLLLTPIEDWLETEARRQRLRSHHNAWVPVIAVHEAYPGHHAHALKIRENPRLLRKIVREPIFSEGWGLYTEELMFELGFLQGDAVRLTQLRNRLWRAARVILDVQLHTGQISFEEAVDFLVEKVRFERYAAELEVGMYIRRPTYVLGYLIGMQEIIAIREAYTRKFGEPDPPSAFFDKLLSAGSIPPALVKRELLAE